MRDGRAHSMGLGPLHTISLADARRKAHAARSMLLDGLDPLEARRSGNRQSALERARKATFAECAERYIRAHAAGWRNAKHGQQWAATLERYAFPIIGELAVGAVDGPLVLKIIEPIWTTKPETAKRVRGRIELILDWATARGLRVGENPARWRGHLDKLLPARSKVAPVKHHAALPYRDIPAFMESLRALSAVSVATAGRRRVNISVSCLEFVILTAARTGEAIGATWPEFDLKNRLWTVPAARMKGKREHRVPLSPRALAILEALPRGSGKGAQFVFQGIAAGKPLSNMALLKALRDMGREDLTTHGFRSTFRDWAADQTTFPSEVAEMALAHAVGDKVEAAYRRGDMFAKRRRLAESWSAYCQSAPRDDQAHVVQIRLHRKGATDG